MGAHYSHANATITEVSPNSQEFELVQRKLTDAAVAFIEEYCEFGHGLYIPVHEFYAAMRSFMYITGLSGELKLFEKFKDFTLSELQLNLRQHSNNIDVYIDRTDPAYQVLANAHLKAWPVRAFHTS